MRHSRVAIFVLNGQQTSSIDYFGHVAYLDHPSAVNSKRYNLEEPKNHTISSIMMMQILDHIQFIEDNRAIIFTRVLSAAAVVKWSTHVLKHPQPRTMLAQRFINTGREILHCQKLNCGLCHWET